MPKTIHITSKALQLGSAGNQNTRMCGSHQEKHQPLGQPKSGGTKQISTG